MRTRLSIFSFIVLNALAAVATAQTGKQEPTNAAGSHTPQTDFSLATATWSPPYSGPEGFPKGARRAALHADPKTGGETYYAHFPAGSRFELHWHAHPEYAVVLRGKVVHTMGTERRTMVAGDYVIIPPKTNHGWEPDPGGDVYLLIRRDGPADFNFAMGKPAAGTRPSILRSPTKASPRELHAARPGPSLSRRLSAKGGIDE